MKMTQGSGTASNYSSYIKGCTLGQYPYRIPVSSLSMVQLYIDIGENKPSSVTYELIDTCSNDVESLSAPDYVVGQDTNQNWYGVFKNFTDSISATCFVIAVTLDSDIYFSEEYCIDNFACANPPTLIKGCYGNLDPLISYNCEGIYFGTHQGPDSAMGDTSVIYTHETLMRGVEVTLSSIKNSFKQGRTRNFRTEKEKIYQFWAELVPEWYIGELDAIFNRGEVYVGSTKYLVNETAFEKIEDCKKAWKPSVTFHESCYQSFSCEPDPCFIASTPVVATCCTPVGVSASVYTTGCCDPEIISAVAEGPGG